MNKSIFITFFVVFISTTLALSSSELYNSIDFDEIIGQINNDDSSSVCNVNNQQLGNCKTINNQLFCQSISKCLEYFTYEQGLIINVPSGHYSASDCPGNVLKAPKGGFLVIQSQSGQANFNCGKNQFINITFSIPTSLLITGIGFIGSAESENGCLELNDISQNGSNAYFNNITAVNCNSNSYINGAFLTANNFNSIYMYNSNITDSTAIQTSTITTYDSTITIYGSYFGYNKGNRGGVVSSDIVYVWNSYFENNYGENAGGCIYASQEIYLINSKFFNNYGRNVGGVISGKRALETLYIDNSIFQNNSASLGGAIYINNGNTTIINSQFYSHLAQRQSKNQGAGGVIYIKSSGDGNILTLINCTFDNNASNFGGAIYLFAASLHATNSTFIYNIANNNGGSIYWRNDNLSPQYISLINCTLNNNFALYDGGALYIDQYYTQSLNLNLAGSIFDHNQANEYAGSIYFEKVPNQFKGGKFTNSKSSESKSMTFYSKSLVGENIVYFENDLPEYNVPIFNEVSFTYWKVFGAQGSCKTGVAIINENGVILSCKKLRNML